MGKSAFGQMLEQGAVKGAGRETAPTLAEIAGSENLREAIGAAVGARATSQDVSDAIGAVCQMVDESVRGVLVAAATVTGARVPSLPKSRKIGPEDVRISTRDGLKVWAYVVHTPEDDGRAQTFGTSVSGVLGKVFGTVALRKS
jgi:hypothetical protein